MKKVAQSKPIKIQKKQQSQSFQVSNNEPVYDGLIIPATKVSPQVIQILRTTKVPQLIIPSHTTISEAANIYFKQYMNLFQENKRLNDELIEMFEQRNSLAQRYNSLKSAQNQFQESIRRKRRYANQIKRDFSCPSSNCNKSYGSEGSLTQHVKLKHEEYYSSGQYEIQLQSLLDQIAKRKIKKQAAQNN